MDGTSSYGTSWADQWDSHSDPKQTTSGSATKYKQKLGEGLGKTKSMASTGVKKVKEGASVGFQWIKHKYHKTAHKR